jgi:hypothetical protein
MGDKIPTQTKHKHMEMIMKLNLLSLAVLAALGASAGAHAAQLPFSFDSNGAAAGGLATDVGVIDWAPGTGYADGGTTAINNFLAGSGSTAFTLYYQANLSTMTAFDNTIKVANGAFGAQYFTAVAGFGEKVVSVGANNSATFDFDPTNPLNYFTIYANTALSNNLTGTGFTAGTKILEAHIVHTDSSNFTIGAGGLTPVTLDQGGGNGDQWAGQQSVTGSGSTDITAAVDSWDPLYFTDFSLAQSLIMTLFNNSQVDPFNQVDPSKCMNTDTLTCVGGVGGIITVGTLGSVNGDATKLGPSFIFQADGNQSFTVPEPGSLALVGLGFAALGFVGSRRRAS